MGSIRIIKAAKSDNETEKIAFEGQILQTINGIADTGIFTNDNEDEELMEVLHIITWPEKNETELETA